MSKKTKHIETPFRFRLCKMNVIPSHVLKEAFQSMKYADSIVLYKPFSSIKKRFSPRFNKTILRFEFIPIIC